MGKKAKAAAAKAGAMTQVGGKSMGPVLSGHLVPLPKSQSKQTARVASLGGGLPAHPGLDLQRGLLGARCGSLQPLRLPDMYLSPTAATVLKAEYNIASNADGDAVFGESYNITGSKLSAVVTAGVLGSVTTAQHPQYTSFAAEAKAARMVAMRVQVTYTGRADEVSGYLSHDIKTETAFGGGNLTDQHVSSVKQVPASDGFTCFVTYTQEPRWEAPNVSQFMLNTFPVPVFFASGLPASKTVYHVRVWRFVEYLPFDNSISEGSMDIEPYNPTELAVNASLAAVGTSVSSAGEANPSTLRGVANAALHIAAPIGRWMVGEARTFMRAQLMAAAANAPLLLAAAA